MDATGFFVRLMLTVLILAVTVTLAVPFAVLRALESLVITYRCAHDWIEQAWRPDRERF